MLLTRKILINVAVSSFLLNSTQVLAEVVFDNPGMDFIKADGLLVQGGGQSILKANNIDLATASLSVRSSDAFGSLTVFANNLNAYSISTILRSSNQSSAQYISDLVINETTQLNSINLDSLKQDSNPNLISQCFSLTTKKLEIDGQNHDAIHLTTGAASVPGQPNTQLITNLEAETINVNTTANAIFVSGNGLPQSDNDGTSLTITGKDITLKGSAGHYYSTNVAVYAEQGATINLVGKENGSSRTIEALKTQPTEYLGDTAIYAKDSTINASFGKQSKINIQGNLIAWRFANNDYLRPKVIVNVLENSETLINGDVLAITSDVEIKTKGQTTINALSSGVQAQSGTITIDIGSESIGNNHYGIRGALIAALGDTVFGDSTINVRLSGENNSLLGVSLIDNGSNLDLTEEDYKHNFINLSLNEKAQWDVGDLGEGQNNYVSLLSLNSGVLNLRYGENGTHYKTLDVNTLSGNNGLILVNAELTKDNEISNRVEIQTAEAGTHRIHVDSASGTEPTKLEQDGYLVRVINDEGATFIADNNKLEYGVYFKDYSIKNRLNENNETEWFLTFDPQPEPDLTPSGEAVVALAGMGAQNAMYLNQLSDVRKRLGEIRNGVKDGIWASVAAQKDRISGFSSTSFDQEAYRFNFGFDRSIGQWLVGANIKAVTANQETKNTEFKADGDSHSQGINLYATWYNEIGCYADFVLSLDRYHQEIENRMLSGTKVKGSYHNLGLGVSIEGGRKFSLGGDKSWFIEPQAQLSYYWMKGDDFSMSNAMEVNQENFDSLTGRLGVVAGKDFNDSLGNNKGQLYARLGVNHEFIGDQAIRVNNIRFSDDLLGTRVYYGLAGEWSPYENIKLFGYVERENGSDYTKEIEISAGIKYTF